VINKISGETRAMKIIQRDTKDNSQFNRISNEAEILKRLVIFLLIL